MFCESQATEHPCSDYNMNL